MDGSGEATFKPGVRLSSSMSVTSPLVPTTGRVEVFGQAVPAPGKALLEMRKGVGVLLQGNGLLTDLTQLLARGIQSLPHRLGHL